MSSRPPPSPNPFFPPGAWPPIFDDPRWLRRIVRGNNPAAGAEISVQVAGGRFWSVISMRFRLVAAAVAVTRVVGLRIGDGTDVVYEAVATPTQLTGETIDYTFSTSAFAQGTAAARGAGVLYAPCIVPRGWTLETLTTNLQGADDFGAPVLLVDEFMGS
jgi:hypothetical protein